MLVAIDFSKDSFNFKSPISKDQMSPGKKISTNDVTQDVNLNTLEGKNYQPKSKVDSSAL